jgi:monoamine oxidase
MTPVGLKRRIELADRRRFLQTAAVAAGGAMLGAPGAGCVTTDRQVQTRKALTPRVAIVGGGLSGLVAAWHLRRAGIESTIYDGALRTGGRIHSARDVVADGLTTELGAEFIDSNHADILALAKSFGLELIDSQANDEAGLIREAYFFGGRLYNEAEIVEQFRPVAATMARDFSALGDEIDYRNDGGAAELDRTSLAAYLDRVAPSGAIRRLLEVAYVSEYGLDTHEQSSLNLLLLIGLDAEERFDVFGESDERYKIRGGNEQLTTALAQSAGERITLGHRLVAVERLGDTYRLTFDVDGSGTTDVDADVVLLAVPFTTLRQVDLRVDLPAVKRKAIAELGYGTNAKLFAGVRTRPWREMGYAGMAFSDEAFQTCWDHTRGQDGPEGGMTMYLGGAAGAGVGSDTPEQQVRRHLHGVSRVFGGTNAAYNKRAARFHWPTHPWTLGSYSCYRPGQWTTIGGAEGEPVDNLFFAGEHTSRDFQGFMNGAAESGRHAARAIAKVAAGRR